LSGHARSDAHRQAGHRLVLKIQTSDDDHVPAFSQDPQVTVFSGKEGTRITLPVVTDLSSRYRDSVDLKAKAFNGSGA
jgi:hypothetical protein